MSISPSALDMDNPVCKLFEQCPECNGFRDLGSVASQGDYHMVSGYHTSISGDDIFEWLRDQKLCSCRTRGHSMSALLVNLLTEAQEDTLLGADGTFWNAWNISMRGLPSFSMILRDTGYKGPELSYTATIHHPDNDWCTDAITPCPVCKQLMESGNPYGSSNFGRVGTYCSPTCAVEGIASDMTLYFPWLPTEADQVLFDLIPLDWELDEDYELCTYHDDGYDYSDPSSDGIFTIPAGTPIRSILNPWTASFKLSFTHQYIHKDVGF